ncbi:MAG TPA: hypothetical protein VGN04_06205 [Herbaspirillum sp.]|jgi:hypothetical protein
MNILKPTLLIISSVALTSCGGMNNYLAAKTQTIEIYHIFDIKTSADTAMMTKAATEGLSENTNEVRTTSPLQIGKSVPEKPGRFTLKDFASAMGGTSGAFIQMAQMQGGGINLKVANCEDAVWNAKATRTISGSSNLILYTCLYKYKTGYNVDMYAVFTKQEGGFYQIGRTVANSLVGTPEEWVNKTILDTIRSIEKATSAQATHLEGQPELNDLPAVEKLGSR